MPDDPLEKLALGEDVRKLDERHRLTVPPGWIERLGAADGKLVLAKERHGCLSVWPAAAWQEQLNKWMDVVVAKLKSDGLKGRIDEVQLLGRLLSTRHAPVELKQGDRLLIPDGFREFLGVEPGGNVVVVGAVVCIELWRPDAFSSYLEKRMPRFRRLLEKLSS
jgi:MraZ protein